MLQSTRYSVHRACHVCCIIPEPSLYKKPRPLIDCENEFSFVPVLPAFDHLATPTRAARRRLNSRLFALDDCRVCGKVEGVATVPKRPAAPAIEALAHHGYRWVEYQQHREDDRRGRTRHAPLLHPRSSPPPPRPPPTGLGRRIASGFAVTAVVQWQFHNCPWFTATAITRSELHGCLPRNDRS